MRDCVEVYETCVPHTNTYYICIHMYINICMCCRWSHFWVHTETTIISKFKVSKLATHTHNGNDVDDGDVTHTQRTEADGDQHGR